MKLFIVFILITIFIGCNKEHSTESQMANTTDLVKISPADNATEVSPSEPITLQFYTKPDPRVVQANLVILSDSLILDSQCPISDSIGHGHMGSAMGHNNTMQHLDSLHSIRGHFSWNNDSTLCRFTPDSALKHGTKHMVHLRTGMMTMMKTMQQQHGGGMMNMGSYQSSEIPDEKYLHFTTKK
ncbi:MAG: hypothetical protein WDA22_10670 [Bacteroidota bacterium]